MQKSARFGLEYGMLPISTLSKQEHARKEGSRCHLYRLQLMQKRSGATSLTRLCVKAILGAYMSAC